MHRRFHALAARPGVDGGPAAVVHAVADHRPAVVQAGPDEVELVAALRSVLVGPQVAGLGVHEQPLRVAVSVAPDLGQGAGLPDERVVVGHAAVVVEADGDAVMVRRVLRGVGRQVAPRAGHPIAHRGEEVSVRVPGQPPPVVTAASGLRLEDVHDLGEPVVLEPAPDHRRRRALFRRPRVAQVQQAVGREVGVRKHLEQSALPPRDHRRDARNRIGQQRPVAHDAQAARALGDEHVAVGQPRDGPGGVEAVGHGHGAVVVKGGALDLLGGAMTSGEHAIPGWRKRQQCESSSTPVTARVPARDRNMEPSRVRACPAGGRFSMIARIHAQVRLGSLSNRSEPEGGIDSREIEPEGARSRIIGG